MSQSLPRRYLKKLTSNFISLVSGFIVTSLVPRELGPLAFGKFTFVTDIFSQVFLFFEGGSSNALYNKVSQNHQNVLILKKYSRFLALVNVIVFLGIGLGLKLDLSKYIFSELEMRFILLGVIYASLFWLNSIYVKVLDGLGLTSKMEKQRIYMSVFRLIGVISIFFLKQITLLNFFIFQILLVLFLNISFLILIYRFSKQYGGLQTENIWTSFYRYSSPLFVYGLVSTLATVADRWLLQRYSGFAEQGNFSLANQLGAICFLFSSSLTPLFHREIAITTNNNDADGTHRLIYTSFPVLFFIAATLGVFCALNAAKVVHLVAGSKFTGETFAYSLMFLYPIHQTYGQLVGTIYLASGETKLYRNIGSGLLVFSIIMSFFMLAPREVFGLNMGFLGVAIKSFIVQLAGVHIFLYFSLKKIKMNIRPFLVNQLVILCVLMSAALLSKFITETLNIQNLVLEVFVNGAFYVFSTTFVIYACYRMRLPIFMNYTQESIDFLLGKLLNLYKSSFQRKMG
jgi:O-antigen/teichoic acid export membrane protein